MKRKFKVALLASIILLASVLALTSCKKKHVHTEVIDPAVAPTCTAIGLTEGKHCSECNEILVSQEENSALGHSASDWITDKAATCKEVGSKHKECTVCKELLETEPIDKLTTHTPVIDSRVEPTFTTAGLTEGSHCGVCDVILVAQNTIPMLPSETVLMSANLTVDGRNISGSFSYATESFSFINDITVTNNAVWVVSTDVYGMQTVATKTVPLNEGNNIFYIHITNSDQTVSTYTVNLYRNHLYTVRFNANGGTSVSTQYLEEGYLAEEPTTSRVGYTFVSWDYNFNSPITSNITINANWNANGDTPYKVEYYLENVDKNGYEEPIIVNHTGTTDTTANAEQKNFEHFTLKSYMSTLSGNINGSGSLVLKVYYTRNTYTISTNINNTKGGTVTSGGTYAYDTEITLTATTNAGYTFLGWFDGETEVCDSLSYTFKVDHAATYTAKWSANTNTAYKVEYYLENVDKNGYEDPIVENLTGTSDTTADAEQKIFTHFTINTSKSTLSGNINGSGSLVLKVYYTRNTYSVNSDDTSIGTISNSGNYGYNKQITVSASVSKLGYTFVGWYSGDELLSIDAEYTLNVDRNVVARFEVKEEMKNFNFTSTATTCSITGIKDKSVTEILVPNYVTSIGSSAFFGCSSLTSVTIPDGVTSIDSYAFYNCSKLTSVTIPDSVTSIGDRAFYVCSSLTSVVIGDSVTSIGYYAFEDCYKLVEVYNKSSLYITKGSSSNGCVGSYAKAIYTEPYTSKLTNDNGYIIYIDGEEKILVGYTGTETALTLPSYITQINQYAFYNCSKLTSVTIPDSVTSIDSCAFQYCSKLTSVTIPDSVTSIGDRAFYGCSSLTSVIIGDSVTSIGSDAFQYCYKLVEVYNKSSLSINGDVGSYAKNIYTQKSGTSKLTNDNGYIIYTDGEEKILIGYTGTETALTLPSYITQINQYAFYNCSSLTSVIIGDSVTSVGSSAFSGCSSLTSVTIPDSVTSIDSYAFYNCSSLTSVTIPDSVTSIGSYAFSSCGLTSVTIPDSVTSIDSYAFYYCNFLTSAIIGDSVTSIGSYAFQYCSRLTSVTIPDSVTSIGSYAFYSCGLTSVTIPDGVTSIDSYAFYNCSKLTSVTIPDSVTSIDSCAFQYCSKLTSVTIPDSVTSIGSSAFSGCSSLTSVTIPDSVTSIGSSAFSGCSSLTSVTIPDSITSIGYKAFYGCSSLTSVTIPDGVTSIGDKAFYGCSSLTSVTIPDGVTSIGNEAFYACYKLVEVYNKSSLSITKGSSSNGYVGSYAKAIYTEPYTSKLTNDNGYIIYTDGEEKILVGYIGTETALTLPSYITQINRYAFYECSSLTSVVIGDSVTSIGYRAFFECDNLTSVVIGDSVTSISNDAFWLCYKLVEVYNKSSLSITKGSSSNGYVGSYAKNIYTPKSGTSKLTNDNGYIIITDGKEKILVGYTGTETDLTLPSYITQINQYAFYYCSKLTSVTISDSLTSIGERAFSNCSSFNINFEGIVEQWNAVQLGHCWNDGVLVLKIICSDGTVT